MCYLFSMLKNTWWMNKQKNEGLSTNSIPPVQTARFFISWNVKLKAHSSSSSRVFTWFFEWGPWHIWVLVHLLQTRKLSLNVAVVALREAANCYVPVLYVAVFSPTVDSIDSWWSLHRSFLKPWFPGNFRRSPGTVDGTVESAPWRCWLWIASQ